MTSDADVPSVADGIERPLDPRVIPLDRDVGLIVTASLALGLVVLLGIFLVATSLPGWVTAVLWLLWAAVTVLLAWWLQQWPAISYRYARYRVDEDGIEIREGVVWRTVTNVPRSRVQHTDVAQGPLQRKYGLGTLIIHTAGTDHATVHVRGLHHATALAIRDHLLPRHGHDAV